MLRDRSNCSVIDVVPMPDERGHLVERRDRGELLFERRRDRRRHRLRAGAGIAGGHRDRREIDVRQRRHRQQP